MSSIPSTSYVLDSRDKNAGSTNSVAVYNMAANANGIEIGTYEMLSFNSKNQVYNVFTGRNDEIYFDEGAAELGPVNLAEGYYTIAALITEIELRMDAVSGSTYTVTNNVTTGVFTVAIAAGTFAFNWGTNSAQPIANNLMGYSAVDGVLAASQVGDRIFDLDPHSNLLILVNEDASRNITLVDGTEYSLYVPLDQAYQSEIDSLKSQTFSQTIQFLSTLNQVTVSLFTEDGIALPLLNSPPYQLIIRKVF